MGRVWVGSALNVLNRQYWTHLVGKSVTHAPWLLAAAVVDVYKLGVGGGMHLLL
jgi:hypothetical protein